MFYVLLVGEGEGCDYTIGCNKTFRKLEASTWQTAREEVADICADCEEPSIAKATILAVTECQDFDIATWKADHRRRKEEEKKKEERARKKAMLEQLKAELESEE